MNKCLTPLLILFVVLFLNCQNGLEKNPIPPNIIFIMTDDHTTQAMSCYGSIINETPNIDRIAKEGMRFNNAFCINSICAPSRAVIFTGKMSHQNEYSTM